MVFSDFKNESRNVRSGNSHRSVASFRGADFTLPQQRRGMFLRRDWRQRADYHAQLQNDLPTSL